MFAECLGKIGPWLMLQGADGASQFHNSEVFATLCPSTMVLKLRFGWGNYDSNPNSLELEHASGNMYLCDLSHVFAMLYVIIVCWSWTCQTQ